MKTAVNISGLILLTLALGACGLFGGDEPDISAIPASEVPTKTLLETVPEGLLPDAENVRHTNETLRADDSVSGGSS